MARGPYYDALVEELANLEVRKAASDPDPMLGAAMFAMGGMWAGARRRAFATAAGLVRRVRADPENMLGDDEETIAKATLAMLRSRLRGRGNA